MRRFRSRSGRVGLVGFVLVLLVALTAPLLAPHDPQEQAIVYRLRPPVWMTQGTTEFDSVPIAWRDTLSRLICGARISLLIGGKCLGAGFVGVLLGLIAGYFGGRIDYAISTLINAAWSFPFILLALIIVAVLGSSVSNLIIALVATSWASFARIVRGEVISLRDREYVDAARALGTPAVLIIAKHILPNVLSSILVIASIEFARAILRESFLSFLGLGVPPSVPSWGGMLSEGRSYIFSHWWLVTLPGVAIFVTSLSINLLGDGLRDAFDPRLRR